MLAGETLGPQFRDLTAAVDHATQGLRGFTPAINSVTSALKGFAAAGSPSGMKPVNQSFDLLASTIGVVVTPAFALMGASVAAAATTLMGDLEPNLDKVAKWYADHFGDVVNFGRAVVDVTRTLVNAAEQLGAVAPAEAADIAAAAHGNPMGMVAEGRRRNPDHPMIGAAVGGWAAFMDLVAGMPAAANEDRQQRARDVLADAIAARPDFVGPPAPPPRPGVEAWDRADVPDEGFMRANANRDFRLKVSDMLGTMIGGMRMDMGGAPGFRRIEDAWRQAQSATFENPMQTMIRQNWDKTIGVLQAIKQKVEAGNAAPNAVNVGPRAAVAGR
jgi:hypothetical protein